MRAIALARITQHPHWYPRITIRPEDFYSASLPHQVGGVILMGVLGYFDEQDRKALFAELAARLPEGGATLFDLQQPEAPAKVDGYEFASVQVGDLTYTGIAEGWPIDEQSMRWRMTYRTSDKQRILSEESVEHVYYHPSKSTVEQEAKAAGLTMTSTGVPTYWLLTRADLPCQDEQTDQCQTSKPRSPWPNRTNRHSAVHHGAHQLYRDGHR